jgi:hypothetical protein
LATLYTTAGFSAEVGTCLGPPSEREFSPDTSSACASNDSYTPVAAHSGCSLNPSACWVSLVSNGLRLDILCICSSLMSYGLRLDIPRRTSLFADLTNTLGINWPRLLAPGASLATKTSGTSRTRSRASRTRSRASRRDKISICLPGRRCMPARCTPARCLRDAYL